MEMEMEMVKVNQEAGVGLLETALSIILLSFALIFLWRGYNKNENYYHASEIAKITCNFANEFAESLSTPQVGAFASKIYKTQAFGDYEVKMLSLSDNLVSGLVLLKQKKNNNINTGDIISNLGFTAAKIDNKSIKSIDGVYEINTEKDSNIKNEMGNAIAAVIIPSKVSNLMICNKGW